MILVTGCPRSGTTYYAGWLRSLGYDFGHEKLGEAGCVSWMFAVEGASYPYSHGGVLRQDLEPTEIVHLVRNPLDCIASMTTLAPKSWAFMDRHIDLDTDNGEIGRAASVWLRWNKLCEEQADKRVRIEDVPYDPLLESNSRGHLPIGWEDLIFLPYADSLRSMARRYGYA